MQISTKRYKKITVSSVGKIASSREPKTNLSRTIMKSNKNIFGNDTDNKLRN